MKPAMLLFSTLVFLAVSFPTSLGTETACSAFDYEEKMLTKMIRLENSLDDLNNKTTEMKTDFETEIDILEAQIEILKIRLNGMDYKPNMCPPDYMYSESLKLCWKFGATEVNWFDAVEVCADEGARLLILNNTAEANFIREYVRAENVQMAWVGANDIVEEGTYRWTNDELVQDTLWSSRNPSDSTTYNCIAISRYGLDDEQCSNKVNYQHICQIVIY